MNNLPEDIQHEIYKYKHNLEYMDVLVELCDDVCYYCGWCGQGHRKWKACECEGGELCETESESEYDSDYEERHRILGPDGDFWYEYIRG